MCAIPALGLLALLALLCPAHDAAALEETRCRLESGRLPAVFAYCATLTVPENRAAAPASAGRGAGADRDADPGARTEPGESRGESVTAGAAPGTPARTLELFVARVPAATAVPQADPLVLIAGGPGQSTIDFYLQMRRAFEPARRHRDILLLDQRGTGRSAAGFECELGDFTQLELSAQDELRMAVQGCLIRLERDPRQFSTSPAVEDLDALRAALGIDAWNLYGISYGTRVAQLYARRYPERVRALVLDGVVPASLALGPGIAPDAQRALDGIFARCQTDARCRGRYPDLEHQFEGLQIRLESGPVSIDIAHPATGRIENRLFSGADLAGVVRLMTYSSSTASLLPLAISEAFAGDYTLLAAQVDILTGDLAAAMSMPMHNSVVCTEDVPYYPTAATATTAGDAGNADSAYLGSSVVDALKAICEVWPAGAHDPLLKAPLEFDGPAMMLSGELDPVTPPRYADGVIASGVRNAVHLVAPGQGHGIAAIGCVPRLIAQFLENASPDDVDGTCLLNEPPMPFFLSTAGPAP